MKTRSSSLLTLDDPDDDEASWRAKGQVSVVPPPSAVSAQLPEASSNPPLPSVLDPRIAALAEYLGEPQSTAARSRVEPTAIPQPRAVRRAPAVAGTEQAEAIAAAQATPLLRATPLAQATVVVPAAPVPQATLVVPAATVSQATLLVEASSVAPLMHVVQRAPELHASSEGPASSAVQIATLSPARPPRAAEASTASLAVVVVAPALVAFVALRFAPFAVVPLGHAMRGDTALASGVLAVICLVSAGALVTHSLGPDRTRGTLLATVAAVLLGVVMIIVTFSAGETAEIESPPAAGALVPFLAMLVPLGLGLTWLANARERWTSKYDRTDATKFFALTSLSLFMVFELSPIGAVHAVTATRTMPGPGTPLADTPRVVTAP